MIDDEIHLVIETRSKYAAPVNENDVANFKTLLQNWNFIREKIKEEKINMLDYVNWESEYPGHVSPTQNELDLVPAYSEENNPFNNKDN